MYLMNGTVVFIVQFLKQLTQEFNQYMNLNMKCLNQNHFRH